MSTKELKTRLIDKIQKTENEGLLGEAYRLLDTDAQDTEGDIYRLNAEQKVAIAQARQQIRDGEFLTGNQADQEIDEWLNK